MRENTSVHVEPLVIWQCACGGREFSKRDYMHLMDCTDCEKLADEIGDALSSMERLLELRKKARSGEQS